MFIKGMECLIEESPEFELAAMVKDEIELIDKLSNRKADVLAVDISSVRWSEEGMIRLRRFAPDIKILAFSQRDPYRSLSQQRNTISDILGSGVNSYLLLCCDKAEITEALIKTAKGERFLCGKVIEALINTPTPSLDSNCPLYSMCGGVNISERELEIIRCVSEGLSNQEIAEKLFLSVHTVNTHRKNIMGKLGINNTAELVMYAVRNQLVN